MQRTGWHECVVRSGAAILAIAAGLLVLSASLRAEMSTVEAWRTSPFHGVTSATGQLIPCICLFRGRQFKVGERVCMQTPEGIKITRCDLVLNNTSWIPTDEPCIISMRKDRVPQSRKS